MQETLAKCWEMQHMTVMMIPAHSMIDAKCIDGELGAIVSISTAPTWISRQVIEPYHVGGCI